MQQFSPKHYAAAAVSSPQHSTESSSFLAPPLTEVFLASAGNSGSVPFNDTFQGAVPASLALATAAATQQQALLAALSTELRNAIDRWCPVGRGGVCAATAAAAADVPASRPLPNAASSVPCSHTSPRCEDGRNKAQLFPRKQQPSSSGEKEQQELVLEEDAPHLADHSVSSSSSSRSKHDETFYWRCREGAAACPAREFLPYISESLPAALSSDGHTSASFNSFSWKKQPRCLYHDSYSSTRVILKTAVSLPTHLYREEAAIEEEDAAGLLGCLEDEGMQSNENSDSALFYSTGDLGATVTPSSRDTKDTQEVAETSDPVAEHVQQPHTMHGDGSSSVSEEEFPSRWGEWPLRTLSSENIQQFVAPAEYESSADRSSTATQGSTNSAATAIRSRSGLVLNLRSRVSKLTTGEDAGSFPDAAASTSKTHAGLSCCWETPETFFENIPSSKADAQTATSTHQITPADAAASTAPAAAAAATTAPAATAAAENLTGERHRPSCPAPAPLPSLAAPPSEQVLRPAASELRLPNASAPPPHEHAVEVTSLATASAEVDASVIFLESAAGAAGVNHLNATPPSSSSSSALRELRAEKSAVGVRTATDDTAEGKREEQRLRSSWKSFAAKEADVCEGGSSIGAEPIEEDFSVSRGDDLRNSGDRSSGDAACSGPAAAEAAESRSTEVSMLRERGCGGLRTQSESEYVLDYDDRNAPGVSSDGGDQTLSKEREKKTEFVQCESRDDRRGDGRSEAVVTASGSNDQSDFQAQNRRRVAVEDQDKLIDAGGGNDPGESAGKVAAARSSSVVGRRPVTTFEEVGLCITSPCSRSSTVRGEEAVDTSGRKEGTTANSYKGRNTLRRKIFVSRSSSAPSVQRSPRAAFSRLGAARISGKPQFSPRLTHRRRRFSVVADDGGDDFLLKSPTRSTLFCTETGSSSLVRAAGGAVACWGVPADRSLLPRMNVTAESVFLAAARKHDEDSETQSHVKSHRAAGQSNHSTRVMQGPEKTTNSADKSSQRMTTSLMEEVIPSSNVQATTQHVALPAARHTAATADKYVAGMKDRQRLQQAISAEDKLQRQHPILDAETPK